MMQPGMANRKWTPAPNYFAGMHASEICFPFFLIMHYNYLLVLSPLSMVYP